MLPAHIGAERVAEIILYPAAARAMQHGDRTRAMEKELHSLEVELELVVAEKGTQVGPAFFVVAIDRQSVGMIARPDGSTRIEPPTAW